MAEVQESMLHEAYDGLVWAYEALDVSQENYAKLVGETTAETRGNYLEGPSCLYSKAKVTYFWVCSKREKAKVLEGFEAAKRKANLG